MKSPFEKEPGWDYGWKAIKIDGTSHPDPNFNGWPLIRFGDEPKEVVAYDIKISNLSACPARPGDGLCVISEGWAYPATDGDVRSIGHCIGLALRWRRHSVLGADFQGSKLRVAKVWVLGMFDPIEWIRSGVPVTLSNANLSGADLRYAILRYAILRDANLFGANLRYAHLWGANLRGANLSGANLLGANLRGANLSGADLSGADLRDANLSDADLRDANLWGANLRDANLFGAIGVAHLKPEILDP